MVNASELFNRQAPAKPQKAGFFGPNMTDVSGQVNNVSRRLRVLEERYLTLRKKTQLTEQNMISSNKKLLGEVRTAFNEITDLRSDLRKLSDQLMLMSSELSDCANKYDLDTLSRYIQLWEPLQFVTSEDAKRMLDESFK